MLKEQIGRNRRYNNSFLARILLAVY